MNYYIQGDAAKADKIKAAFEKKGINTSDWEFINPCDLYFNVGSEIYTIDYSIRHIVTGRQDYTFLELPIEPKFKVGDDIKTGNTIETIAEIDHVTRSYCCESGRTIWFENQDLWHLAPKPHYDIANLKPFDKVLVRDDDADMWEAILYSNYDKNTERHFVAMGYCYNQCIPFEGNEHLLGTNDMCDDRFINW